MLLLSAMQFWMFAHVSTHSRPRVGCDSAQGTLIADTVGLPTIQTFMGYLNRLLPLLLAWELLDKSPDKHAAELFAGERAVSKNLASFGYLVQSFDARYTRDHDLLKPAGFCVAVVTGPLPRLIW